MSDYIKENSAISFNDAQKKGILRYNSEKIKTKKIKGFMIIKNKKDNKYDNNKNIKKSKDKKVIDNKKDVDNKYKNTKIIDKKENKDKNQIDNNLKTLDIQQNKEFINFQKKYMLKNILKIKKTQNNNKIRHYFNIWKFDKNKNISPITKQNNDSILKKCAAKIIYISINNINKKLLIKKLNKWRRITDNISNEDNSLKRSKNIYVFSDIIRCIIHKKYFNGLISKLKKNKINPKNKVLKKIITNLIKKKSNNQQKLLTKNLLKWYNITNNNNNHNNNLLEKENNLNDLLLNIFEKREKNAYDSLAFCIRKWNTITKKLSCLNKIKLIQKNYRIYTTNKESNKYKTFLYNISKNKLIYTLNEIAKFNILKMSITNIPKNKVIQKMKEKIIKNKITKLLEKILKNNDNKNKNAKMNYYISKWSNRVNYIKNKDNKKLKVLLMRIVNRKDNLHNLLKLYYSRWKRLYNLLSIVDAVVKIQKKWRKKKAIDNYNKKKDDQNIIRNVLKAYKKNKYISFINKLKDKNKKYLLINIEKDFSNKRNDTLKFIMDKIKTYIKYKYLSKTTKIADSLKNRIIIKYFGTWKNRTNNKNKAYNILNKIFEKKEFVNNGLALSNLLKWSYRSKCADMEQKVTTIQNKFRNYKKNNASINKWAKLKKILNEKKNKEEIKYIIKQIKVYQAFNSIKNNIKKNVRKNVLRAFNHHSKVLLFIKLMKKILIEMNENKSSKLLKKYYKIWENNISKEIEREEKLNDLLYVIEKRMNINSANYLSYVSLLKNIFDGVLKIRKLDCFKKLRGFYERNKNIDNLSKSLSLAYNDLKLKKKKYLITKILKYFVYHKLLKLFEKLKQKKEKRLKAYKTLFITYLKKKLEINNSTILSDNAKKKRNSQPIKMLFKPKPKVTGIKQMNKSKNKSQGVIKVKVNKDQKKIKDKEKDKTKDKIGVHKKTVVKGAINKTNQKKDKDKEKEKENVKENLKDKEIVKEKEKESDIISISNKSEEESESEIENIKENINYLYTIIDKVFNRQKKDYLYTFKETALSIKTEKEIEEEKILYTHKLYKTLKRLIIKKIFIKKDEIYSAKKLLSLIKLTTINSQISTDRWIRQLLRRWRFISFVKNVSKKKLELMYKNLHVGYLEIINALFNNESQFPSMMKEFENFGADIGMYKNSDYYINKEKDLYQKVKKKYISKPVEYDRENSLKIESGKFINELKYKSDEGEDTDFIFMDSDKDVLKKQKGVRISNNYDCDK